MLAVTLKIKVMILSFLARMVVVVFSKACTELLLLILQVIGDLRSQGSHVTVPVVVKSNSCF